MRRLRSLAFLTMLAAPLIACEEVPPPKTGLNYSDNAKRAYDAAMQEFDAHNWIEAQALMREVKRKYGQTKHGRLAELRIADADFEQEKFAEALRGYKQFSHDHKNDTEMFEYARARAAETQYREIGDSFFMPTGEERDQAAVVDAYKEIAGFLRDFPDARESYRVCGLLADVTARLVRHEMYVARFYLAKDNYDAAVLRLQYAMRNYAADPPCSTVPKAGHSEVSPVVRTVPPSHEADFGLAPDTLMLLGEVYMKMKKWDDAKAAFGAVVSRYQASPLALEAQKYLEELKRRA